jgi:broad specificity phosphatase PhoE
MTTSQLTLYLFRHGQTAWSLSGQHTGLTDIPLTEHGRAQALALRDMVSQVNFSLVLVSPLSRAKETATLAGLTPAMTICDDLAEFDYGEYEGLTTDQIQERVPGWTIWNDPCPGGESLQDAARRCHKVIDTAHGAGGNVAIVAHGHILRILTATWLELSPENGKCFMLDTSTASILSHEHDLPAIKIWNARCPTIG